MNKVKPLPKWLQLRYAALWAVFQKIAFSHDQAAELLKEENERLISVILSELKKAGWLTLQLHPDDSRKRLYTLVEPDMVMHQMGAKDE
jgi:type I restriction enzyme M protein